MSRRSGVSRRASKTRFGEPELDDRKAWPGAFVERRGPPFPARELTAGSNELLVRTVRERERTDFMANIFVFAMFVLLESSNRQAFHCGLTSFEIGPWNWKPLAKLQDTG